MYNIKHNKFLKLFWTTPNRPELNAINLAEYRIRTDYFYKNLIQIFFKANMGWVSTFLSNYFSCIYVEPKFVLCEFGQNKIRGLDARFKSLQTNHFVNVFYIKRVNSTFLKHGLFSKS